MSIDGEQDKPMGFPRKLHPLRRALDWCLGWRIVIVDVRDDRNATYLRNIFTGKRRARGLGVLDMGWVCTGEWTHRLWRHEHFSAQRPN